MKMKMHFRPGEEDEEIDQFNDDTFGSGAVGMAAFFFSCLGLLLFSKCCLLSALILLS